MLVEIIAHMTNKWIGPGISRDSAHKRRLTGGRREPIRKKRKFLLGRPAALTKLVSGIPKRVRTVRARGGNLKYRALRLDSGNFSWGSEGRFFVVVPACLLDGGGCWSSRMAGSGSLANESVRGTAITHKARLLNVVYNASNNELVRTNTLMKNAIVQIDATPFRQWYKSHYNADLGVKKGKEAASKEGVKEAALSKSREAKIKSRLAKIKPVPSALVDQFTSGRLLACISSRPGQCGRADGYILEGPELDFYVRKLKKK